MAKCILPTQKDGLLLQHPFCRLFLIVLLDFFSDLDADCFELADFIGEKKRLMLWRGVRWSRNCWSSRYGMIGSWKKQEKNNMKRGENNLWMCTFLTVTEDVALFSFKDKKSASNDSSRALDKRRKKPLPFLLQVCWKVKLLFVCRAYLRTRQSVAWRRCWEKCCRWCIWYIKQTILIQSRRKIVFLKFNLQDGCLPVGVKVDKRNSDDAGFSFRRLGRCRWKPRNECFRWLTLCNNALRPQQPAPPFYSNI